MNDKAYIVLPGLEPTVWSHPLEPREQTLGRSNKCDVQLVHDTVSRQHAVIWGAPGSYFIRDLESSNGTFVEDERITEKLSLDIGMRIRLGEVTLNVIGQTDHEANTVIHGLMATKPIRSGMTAHISIAIGKLSEAQVRVLQLLFKGLKEKKVADVLELSEHTVHTHVKNIYRKLGVRSRAQLMARVFAQSDN